jgi:hypothetical protein
MNFSKLHLSLSDPDNSTASNNFDMMLPQRASMENPTSHSNLPHQRASGTEEMREQQHQFAENEHVPMSDKAAVVVCEVETRPDPTAQKKQRVPAKKEKAEKKKSTTKRWMKVKEKRAAQGQLALAEVQDELGLLFQGRREVWEPNHHGHDEQIDFTPIEEE